MAVFVAVIFFYLSTIEESKREIVSGNKQLAEAGLQKATKAITPILDSLSHAGFFSDQQLSRYDERRIDTLLSSVITDVLDTLKGMEGGCYFLRYDQFFGYAYPTSPPPIPSYGPPPRSYNIIREQVRQSILENRTIIALHQFDPATFPLATQPLYVHEHIVGGVWTRIHIERLIPNVSLTTVFLSASVILLICLAGALAFVGSLRKRLNELHTGMLTLHDNSGFRFPQQSGVFGFITHSINEMIDARSIDQERHRNIELEMHQQDKLASLGKLVASVAHEVKTPLAIIKTRIQLWGRTFRSKNRKATSHSVITSESMGLVLEEIDRLTTLVNKLLVFSKPAMKKEPFDINTLIKRLTTLMQNEFQSHSISLDPLLASQLPLVPADRQAIEQVLLNVLANAIEAMPTGGILTVCTIHLHDAKRVQLRIQDTGRGIPEEIKQRVFDPFFTTKEKGTGLGLSIAYQLIQAHGGRIYFESGQHQGTNFVIELPTEQQ
jgi:signal transduction histidine kinase